MYSRETMERSGLALSVFRPHAAPIGFLVALLLAIGGPGVSGSSAGEPPEGWIRVSHPVHPLTFEIPREMRLLVAPAAGLGRVRARNGTRHDVLLFVLRPMGEFPRLRHALEVVFLWVTREARGTDRERLAGLGGGLAEVEAAAEFVREVLYREVPHVSLVDRGPLRVAGQRARRVAVARRTLVGTPHEHRIEGEAVVVEIHPAAALIVLGRFGEEATIEERQIVFPGIVRSIRLRDALDL